MVLREPGHPHPHAWSLSTENLKGATKLRYGGHRVPRGYWGTYEPNPSVTQAGWNHFAYVFDGEGESPKARLYWNGILASESSPPPPAFTPAQRLYIGGAPGSAGWSGYLDEVRFTAAALSPEQFLQASDTPGKPEGPATPIALGLRKEAPQPLARPVALDLPPPAVGLASVHVPEDAGLVNVKTAFGAKGDGQTDDTEAIRRAVAAHVGKHATLYFPPGTYVVGESIDWRDGKGGFNAFLTWQGAGMGRTFFYLRDGATAFGDPANPRPIVRTGSIPGMGGANPVTGAGNRAHNNYLMDLTFVVGRNNPGAVGVDFNASNTGAMENIRIVALDRAVDGLLLNRQVGCLLVKNLEVQGFDVGVRCGGDLYGSTLVNVHLQGQRVAGLLNEGHMVALQGLRSVNTVGRHIALGTGQAWRAWQLNIEVGGPAAMVENRGGTFWVLGYKTEKGNTVLRAQGGRSEILGGLWYPAQGVKDPAMAAIEALDADLTASFTDMSKGGGQYKVKVRETRGGETSEIPHAGLQRHWGMSGSLSLFRAAGATEL